MFKRRDEESAFNWPVVGIDLPYPEHVQAALDRVEAETRRRRRLECTHPRTQFRFAERGAWLGLHADKGRERYCVACGRVFEFEPDPPAAQVPITIVQKGSGGSGLTEVLAQQLADEVRQLTPRERGPMRKDE